MHSAWLIDIEKRFYGMTSASDDLTKSAYPNHVTGERSGALPIRPKLPKIPGVEVNGTDIFLNFIPKFLVYLTKLA